MHDMPAGAQLIKVHCSQCLVQLQQLRDQVANGTMKSYQCSNFASKTSSLALQQILRRQQQSLAKKEHDGHLTPAAVRNSIIPGQEHCLIWSQG